MKSLLKELNRSDLINFYLKSTLDKSNSYVIIHGHNLIPGAAAELGDMFGVELTPSDDVEISVIQIEDLKKAQNLCKEAFKKYDHLSFELWEKGRCIKSWS